MLGNHASENTKYAIYKQLFALQIGFLKNSEYWIVLQIETQVKHFTEWRAVNMFCISPVSLFKIQKF